LKKAFKLFLKNRLAEGLDIIDHLSSLNLGPKDKAKLKKVLEILLLGELLGLHTMSSILSTFHITSNNLQKLWQGFDYQKITLLANQISRTNFTNKIVELSKKSESSWSRAEVTTVIDDSIFKQWLKNMPIGGEFAKFFSGQTHSTVYGFRITLLGVSIGDEFYPLYFYLSSKKEKTKEVALKLLKKLRRLLKEIADSEGISYPNLFLSVDSGFTDKDLITYCERTGIVFIGVPRKNCKFIIGRYDLNLKNQIEKLYIKKEVAHNKTYEKKDLPTPPFLLRKKANFKWLGKEVILIFFRLKNSKRVTVIFTTNLVVKAKTLRRRFFQRTKIEIFFRILKDTLKIQTSKSVDVASFLKKLSLFIIKAMVCQGFTKFCQRNFKTFYKWAFTKLRHHLIYQQIGLEDLEKLVKTRGFAT